jgi:hypothetical protein
MLLASWTITGLPAHPLIVHVAVILVPLAAIGLVATGWRADWRRHYSLPVALLAVAGALAAFLADQSGEGLEDRVRDAARAAGAVRPQLGDHPEDGQRAMILAFVLAGLAVALWAVDRWGTRFKLPPWSDRAVYGVGAVVSLAALVVMVAAGHSGATLVWKDLGNFVGR